MSAQQAVVFRVSSALNGDQWFANLIEADHAAREVLAKGFAVSVFPVPVPATTDGFLQFLAGYEPRKPDHPHANTSEVFRLIGEDIQISRPSR